MNSTIYRQYDSRWASKPYPTSGSTFSGNGCGACACTHVLIEQEKYKNYTPETLRKYMVSQGFAVYNKGTTWSGIKKTLEHYGYTVKHIDVSDPMSKVWEECNKGNRIGVILFSGGAGPDGTVWTAGGHYMSFTGYKIVDGLHKFYMKDSGPRKHDGWYSYEKSMKGRFYQAWIVENNPKTATKDSSSSSSSSSLSVDGDFGSQSVKKLEKVFSITQDGYIGGQNSKYKSNHTGISAVKYTGTGSAVVRKMQKWLGLTEDGQLGPKTIKSFQTKLNMTAKDGIWGKNTSKAAQRWLNTNPKITYPTKTTATTKTTSAKFTKEKVVDVSYAQSKEIDWEKVKKAGISGTIVRCGYRGYETAKLNEDAMFLKHLKGAYKAGLKVGVYFFTEAITEAEGKEEAKYTIKLIEKAGIKLNYPVAIDTENITVPKGSKTPRANSSVLTKANRTKAINGFCSYMKSKGYDTMIYASTDWLNNKLTMSKLPYGVWVAEWSSKVSYKGDYIVWQYTDKGSINGINGKVDVNYCYKEF